MDLKKVRGLGELGWIFQGPEAQRILSLPYPCVFRTPRAVPEKFWYLTANLKHSGFPYS